MSTKSNFANFPRVEWESGDQQAWTLRNITRLQSSKSTKSKVSPLISTDSDSIRIKVLKKTIKMNKSTTKITTTLILMILVVIGIVIATTTTATTTTTTMNATATTTTINITMTVYDFTNTPNPFTCETKWIGDGICDDETNSLKCGFDDGDCCVNEIVDTNCYKCICHIDGKRHQMTTISPTIPILPIQMVDVSKFLILTGCSIDGTVDECSHEEPRKKIEVIDVQNPLNSCSLPEEFPIRLFDAVGGLTKDGPLLCGGYNLDSDTPSNECFTFQNSKFIATHVRLLSERYRASSVVLPDGELWIHGGSAKLEKLSSSEIVTLQGSEDGMEIEEANKKHCSMMINSTTALITGGKAGQFSYFTYFVNIIDWRWTKGPQMAESRAAHGCAVFMHNGQNYAIVAGGFNGYGNAGQSYNYLSSTEILDLNNGILSWKKGPELPVQMDHFPLVSTSQGIMAVGGYDYTNGKYKDELLNMKCEDGKDISECKWEEYPKKLDFARSNHVVIPLLASSVIQCNTTLF